MPLATSQNRRLLHRREICIHGFSRDDGGYDVEGHLTDTRTEPHETGWRAVPAGEQLHDIFVRLSVDRDCRVDAVDVAMTATPYPDTCPQITPSYDRLVGRRIDRGWTRAVEEETGSVHGCAHVRELLGRMAQTAFLTVFLDPARGPTNDRPPFIDGCHALASDGAIVLEAWPAFHIVRGTDDEQRHSMGMER